MLKKNPFKWLMLIVAIIIVIGAIFLINNNNSKEKNSAESKSGIFETVNDQLNTDVEVGYWGL